MSRLVGRLVTDVMRTCLLDLNNFLRREVTFTRGTTSTFMSILTDEGLIHFYTSFTFVR